MRRYLQLLVWTITLFATVAVAGINWKTVWLEPRIPFRITAGETQPYTVMGLNGGDTTANLTKSPYLKITSSDTGILEIDQKNAVLLGKKSGQAEIRISFSEATAIVKALVREKDGSAAGASRPESQQESVADLWASGCASFAVAANISGCRALHTR